MDSKLNKQTLLVKGFRLTIWTVNVYYDLEDAETTGSFRLTMKNVN